MRRVRRSALAAMLLDELPMAATFWDGRKRWVPRRVARLFALWRRIGATEAGAAYAAYPGGDVLDVGAYHGFYSLLLAPKAAPGASFLSLEPDLRALPGLLANLATAARLFPHVSFGTLAAPAGDGGAARHDLPMGSSGHPRVVDSNEQTSVAATSTLRIDTVVKALGLEPSFLKVDVEGAEIGVLRGARQTLEAAKPVVLIEVHPGWLTEPGAEEAIANCARECSFSVVELDNTSLSRRELWTPRP